MKATSSKGRSPWKVKKARGTVAGGIVIPKDAILVNQGLGKIKLEEDFVEQKAELPISMEIGQDPSSTTNCADAVSGDGEAFTEEYQVTKVEVDCPNIPMSSEDSEDTPAPIVEDGHRDHNHGSSISCTDEENESLKTTVNKLRLQVEQQNEVIKKQDEVIKKQNEVIGGMKIFMRNIGLSMVTYFNDGENEANDGGRRLGNNEESPANNSGNELNLLEPSGSDSPPAQSRVTVNASECEDCDNALIDNECGGHMGGNDNDDIMNVDETSVGDNNGSSNEHEGHAIESTSEQNQDGALGSPEPSSSKAGFISEQDSEDEKDTDLDDDDDTDLQENDDDGSYVREDSEGESHTEMESDTVRQRNQRKLSSTKVSTKINEESSTSTTDSTAHSKGRFGCSKCDKSYASKYVLREHMLDKHSKNRPQYKCHLCPKVFNRKTTVNTHINLFHKCIRHKCTYCPGIFYLKRDAVKHEKSVHQEGATPSQHCKICGVQLNSIKSLQHHVASKHYKSGTSPSVKSLQKKRKPETGRTKVFWCQHCYSTFREWKDLQCHLSKSHGI